MTTSLTRYQQLVADWQQRTREHAATLRRGTETALRYGPDTEPAIADRLLLNGVTIEGGEGILVSKDRVENGPWIRVYDATANNGDGGYVWAKGNVTIPDHAIEAVVYSRTAGDWDAVATLAARWPARPCSESLAEYPTSDADAAMTDEDHAAAEFCPGCESMVELDRVDENWIRRAHDINGQELDH